MKMRFSASDVTQEVSCRTLPDSDYQLLVDDLGEGYRRSLSREYMSGIAAYLQETQDRKSTGDNRILFLAPDANIARQGYLALRRELLRRGVDTTVDADDGYGDYYRASGIFGREKSCVEETLIVAADQFLKRMPEDPEEVNISLTGLFFRKSTSEKEKGDALEKAESVLVELGNAREPDEAADWVLGLDKRWTAVWLRPAASYEYVMKRLVFEGGYRVVELRNPSRRDYLDYAEEYLAYHHFHADRKALGEMLDALRGYRGKLLAERDIYLHLGRCMERAARRGKRELAAEDISVVYDRQGTSAREELGRVIGLDQVKETLLRRVEARRLMLDCRVEMHGNYIMEGPPGTGKSKMARLLAGLMAEAGISNGRFVDASRSDIIGRYLGHTAANVREVFERAEGGVLFVDEASFLLGEDIYVREAVLEFVRYMELCPGTTVIFATYPEEGEKLLLCDPGFASRIYQVLMFAPYTDEELYGIMGVLAQDYQFALEDDCRRELYRYLEVMRRKKNFGNAREVRRLLETAIEEFGLRTAAGGGDADTGPGRALAGTDVGRAADYLLKNMEREEKRLGFVC